MNPLPKSKGFYLLINIIMADLNLEKFVAFTKTRAFVFPSSEIYGGMAGIYDYGHYGILLKNNIQKAWTKHMVQMREDVYLLDSAIFMHPTTWVASGHVDNFDDPLIDCKNCKSRFRADHVLEEYNIDADKAPINEINGHLDELRHQGTLKCSVCGSKDLTEARKFSMMVKSNMGSPVDALTEENLVYLRPEACGGIYLDYKNMVESLHPKIPFGIAQVGKAFRNEIVARQFIFRTRELEQMDVQYFIHPDDMEKTFEDWKDYRWNWYLEYGIKEDNLKWYKHEKLAHYASNAYDVTYNFQSLGGFKEVEGIHARGNWDLSQHSKFSGANLDFFDQVRNEKYIPHICETSAGLNRMVMMFLDQAYTEETVPPKAGVPMEQNEDTRIVLKLDKRLAPIKLAILPLMKKDGLAEKAKELLKNLKSNTDEFIEYDEAGSIGKRYRRQDEIGTPYCITIDYETLENNTVTLRDRDTMEQQRISIDQVSSYI